MEDKKQGNGKKIRRVQRGEGVRKGDERGGALRSAGIFFLFFVALAFLISFVINFRLA